jgi:hypothetical protein
MPSPVQKEQQRRKSLVQSHAASVARERRISSVVASWQQPEPTSARKQNDAEPGTARLPRPQPPPASPSSYSDRSMESDPAPAGLVTGDGGGLRRGAPSGRSLGIGYAPASEAFLDSLALDSIQPALYSSSGGGGVGASFAAQTSGRAGGGGQMAASPRLLGGRPLSPRELSLALPPPSRSPRMLPSDLSGGADAAAATAHTPRQPPSPRSEAMISLRATRSAAAGLRSVGNTRGEVPSYSAGDASASSRSRARGGRGGGGLRSIQTSYPTVTAALDDDAAYGSRYGSGGAPHALTTPRRHGGMHHPIVYPSRITSEAVHPRLPPAALGLSPRGPQQQPLPRAAPTADPGSHSVPSRKQQFWSDPLPRDSHPMSAHIPREGGGTGGGIDPAPWPTPTRAEHPASLRAVSPLAATARGLSPMQPPGSTSSYDPLDRLGHPPVSPAASAAPRAYRSEAQLAALRLTPRSTAVPSPSNERLLRSSPSAPQMRGADGAVGRSPSSGSGRPRMAAPRVDDELITSLY